MHFAEDEAERLPIGVMPMTGAVTPPCVVAVPGSGKPTLPQPVCPPTYQQTLSASVTVEYSVR